jgi:hypothetical protein
MSEAAKAEIVAAGNHQPNPYDEQPAVTPMELMQLALQKGVDINQLEKLMDLQMRWEANEAKKAFQEAMAAFKSELPIILKNRIADFESKRTGGQVSYEWADLGNVCEKLIPALSKHGITHNWRTEQKDGKVRVTCILSKGIHSEDRSTLEAAPDDSGTKNPIQAMASTVSYLERYTFTAACGVAVKGQDNDGQGAPKWANLQQYLDAIKLCHNLEILQKTFKEGVKEAMDAKDTAAMLALAQAKDARKIEILKTEAA